MSPEIRSPFDNGPLEVLLETRSAAIHHVMFRVDDLRGTVDALRLTFNALDEGFALTQFVHPKDTSGVLIELGEV